MNRGAMDRLEVGLTGLLNGRKIESVHCKVDGEGISGEYHATEFTIVLVPDNREETACEVRISAKPCVQTDIELVFHHLTTRCERL